MSKAILVLLALSVLSLVLGGCCLQGDTHADSGSKTACSACAEGQAGGTVWCDHCGVGYVDGAKTACAGCYAAKTGGPACPTCSR